MLCVLLVSSILVPSTTTRTHKTKSHQLNAITMENSINNIIVFSIQGNYQNNMNNRIHFLIAYRLNVCATEMNEEIRKKKKRIGEEKK